MAQKHGSCLCGAVTYVLTGEPVTRVLCHCINCQKLSGSAFQANLFYKKENFNLNSGLDVLRSYNGAVSDSGAKPVRSFCGNCGSNIMATTDAHAAVKNLVIVMSGCIDDPNDRKMGDGPLRQYYCKRAQSWVDVKSDSQRFQEST